MGWLWLFLDRKLGSRNRRNQVIEHSLQTCKTPTQKVLTLLSVSRGGNDWVHICVHTMMMPSQTKDLLAELVADGKIVKHVAHPRKSSTIPIYTLPQDRPAKAWHTEPVVA